MADTKISALTDGAPAVATDILGLSRAGANVRLTIQNLFNLWGALIAAATGKTTAVDADSLLIQDSAAAAANKQLTMANLSAYIAAKLGHQVLAKSGVGVSCPADTTEDVLATITIPAGAMGPNGFLRIYSLWSCTNNANVKTVRMRLGGAAGTLFLSSAVTSQAQYADQRVIANRNSASSQVGATSSVGAGWGVSGSVVATSAIDTSVSTTLVLTGQKATAGDTLTLESYVVELMYGA